MTGPIRVAFVLAGLHRVNRGAEVAFESIGAELARRGGFAVTLFGSGEGRPGDPYAFRRVGCVDRRRFEGWPRVPMLRSETGWEELTFACRLAAEFDPTEFDATVTCAFPWTNLWLRRWARRGPRHVFVTQNGDWPCRREGREYRLFGCDALVCTNPDYYDTHRDRYRTRLIPNGVDPRVFRPGPGDRARFGIPAGGPVVLMVSALIASKRVEAGVRAVARVPGAVLVVAGDGPLRGEVEALASAELPGRFVRVAVPRPEMPSLYRSADVFLHMSMDESSANAYLEALATALPVVTHDRRVTRWTFDGTARLVDTTDLDAVAAAIASVGADRPDPGPARSLAERRFDWRAIGAQYAELLEDLCRAE